MNYITLNNRKKQVDEILEFDDENEFDDNKPILVQEAYIKEKLYASRLIRDTNSPNSYDWQLVKTPA